jgi:hypothetical protein
MSKAKSFLNESEMTREDFDFTYSHKGYMLTYKGKPIGGAGTLPTGKPKHWKHQRADLKMYREDANREIQDLLQGRGQARFLKVIKEIDQEGLMKNKESHMSKAKDFLRSMSESKKTIEILGHTVTYEYKDSYKGDMDDVDIEHIGELLADGYVEGELFTSDPKKPNKTHDGWWWKGER